MEKGTVIPYSLDKLQDRGKFFIRPGEEIYTGQVIGENSRAGIWCQCDQDQKTLKCSCSWFG